MDMCRDFGGRVDPRAKRRMAEDEYRSQEFRAGTTAGPSGFFEMQGTAYGEKKYYGYDPAMDVNKKEVKKKREEVILCLCTKHLWS